MKAFFFGSFNPMHYGHLEQIEQLRVKGYEVELIISPHNPHKDLDSLFPFDLRVSICEAALSDVHTLRYLSYININTIENNLDKPNYTYKTLRILTDLYGHKPALAMGTDVINSLVEWKNSEEIMSYPIIQLYRPGYTINDSICNKIDIIDKINTYSNTSSSEIRKAMKNGDIDFVKENMTESSFILYNRYYNINEIIKNG